MALLCCDQRLVAMIVGVRSGVCAPRFLTQRKTKKRGFALARAASQEEEVSAAEAESGIGMPEQGDGGYVAKLVSGCVAGACVIKYGSLVFPGLTNPSLSQALAMILAPVLAAVAILILATRRQKNLK